MEDRKCSNDIKHQSSSCSARLLATLATSPFEELSKGEQSRVAEHAKTCSACSAVLAQEQQVEEIMRAFASPERYPDEPELNLLSVIQQVREQEHAKAAERRRKKAHCRVAWFGGGRVWAWLGILFAISTVLIIQMSAYSGVIASILALAQCLTALGLGIARTKQRKSERAYKLDELTNRKEHKE